MQEKVWKRDRWAVVFQFTVSFATVALKSYEYTQQHSYLEWGQDQTGFHGMRIRMT